MLRRELAGRVPLIGFSGSPWTLACYMVEGGGSDDFRLIKGLSYTDPAALHRLLALLADTVADYLTAQAAAGAQALMLFDTWGGVLSTPGYREFSLAYQARVTELLNSRPATRDLPLIVFTKGAGRWLAEQAQIGCAALGVDWTQELGDVRAATGGRWRCRAIWTRSRCSVRPSASAPRRPAFWKAMAPARGMCSTWATACCSRPIRITWRCWWMPSTS